MDDNRLRHLLTQYVDNTITRDDCEELMAYLNQRTPSISAAIDRVMEVDNSTIRLSPYQQEDIYNRLLADIRKRQACIDELPVSRTSYLRTWLRVAAALAIAIATGILFFQLNSPNADNSADAAKIDDILLPDHRQAILTLADGRTVVLSDTLDGILALEPGVSIRRAADGSIVYDINPSNTSDGAHKYNTFSTPKGNSYQLLLPDGTKIWLNTASSIRYPVTFAANERKVSLTGEAYFDVAHDASKPFKVEAKGSVIQVLGTQFNVSAFEDEAWVTTTLLEGAVNVSKSKRHVVLKPGEQAVVDEKTGEIHQSQVDTRAVTAWKSGYFRFDDEPIEAIIKKISRWYDIETVEYEGKFSDRFTGTFQRSKGVSLLFNHLEKLAPIRFEIKERRVVIMK